MTDYKFIKFLKDKKMVDAYQYYEACSYKLYLAQLSLSALNNVVADYQKKETDVAEEFYRDAATKGKGTYSAHTNSVNYLGVEASPTVIMDKLTMEILSLLHNFFDTFAQWLNASLFAEDGLPMERVSLTKVAGKMASFPEYTGQFITDVIALPTNQEYLYIADYNNTLKHRRQIYVENKFDILAVKGSVAVPEFEKDGRPHVKENALDLLKKKINFCSSILDDSKTYVETFFANVDNQHVAHRLYNPKTYLFFGSEEDYKAMRSPVNHYHYIEVDAANIQDSYQVLLVCDRMNGSEEESIEVFNSPYPIIMLRDSASERIVVDDSLVGVLNIILWQLTLILSGFLCQWVNHIFLLKEKVTSVGNVSKNLADGCISKVLSLIGLYTHFFELLFCGLSGETFEKIVEDEFYDFGFFWFNDKMVTFPAIAVNHKATVWNSLFETFSGAPFDIVADTDAFFLCKGCQKRQHDLAIAGE